MRRPVKFEYNATIFPSANRHLPNANTVPDYIIFMFFYRLPSNPKGVHDQRKGT